MPATFLHGVETIQVKTPGGVINIVKSSVVALVGIAPQGPVNQLTLCLSATDDAQFGKPVPGFNIPKTLDLIRKTAGNCVVIVINTFDTTSNLAAVSLEDQTVTGGKIKLNYAPIGAVVIKKSDGTTNAALVKDTDYTIDAYGNISIISNATDGAESTALKFTYSRLNPSLVTASQILGSYNSTTGVRTGLTLLDVAYNTYGYNPKILIAPGYTTLSGVAAQMRSLAVKYRAVYLQDAPSGVTVAGAISGRGVSGTINFNTSDPRVMLLYPWVKVYDEATNADINYPYSAVFAGVMVKNDLDNGYWYSPSNKEMTIVTGIERYITWSINDSSSDANQLNAAGITTVGQGFGTGFRTWGNRSAAFPTSTDPKNFINIQRAADIVDESIELAAIEFMDLPLTQATIDVIRNAGNALMKSLISNGAFLPGSRVDYYQEDNPAAELAAGHVTFTKIFMVPPPAERITFKSVLDITLLNKLK